MRPSPLLLSALAALLLGACQSTSGGPPPAPPPEQAAPGVTPSTFRMPAGSGCSGEVERFQAVIDNDVATGHTTKGVHDRVSGEIAQARTLCSSGNEAGAIGRIRATKAKFGYPG
ncbi:hypothetical protein [Bosea sp. (in: a-proteobacteria)]|uniref:hypothetical protein n=1 Tax=Bosea sp. (in: a-proteobacteria) TaxID=1871050 RepID=UPI002616C8E0|nr:hypothetical protein [Bosea sp. (in: a-proteobacteria)]MCO5091963.1 hypothetical protein [Bosea sp. (in: a-proteobacteria)]